MEHDLSIAATTTQVAISHAQEHTGKMENNGAQGMELVLNTVPTETQARQAHPHGVLTCTPTSIDT